MSPTNNADEVRLSTDLLATFDRNVVGITSGLITLTNLTTGGSTAMTIPDSRVYITNNTMEISVPGNLLALGQEYAVLIGANAIEDLGGTNFAGIADTATWHFSASADVNWSLIAYWPCDEGPEGPISNGTILDDIIDNPFGDEVDGAMNSGGSYTNDPERGRIVWRTTEGNRAQAGNTEMNRNFTWQCWTKTVGGDNGTMMGTRDGAYARFFPNSLAADGYSISWTFNGTYNDDQWHHFVFSRSNDTFSVYVDGVFDSSLVRDRGDNNMKLELGGSSRYSEDLNGYMSDIAIWEEVLTLKRIQELANGAPVIIPPPAGTVVRIK